MKNKNLLVLVAVGTLLFGVTSATSDYMHYQTVNGIGTISICDPSSNGTKCITMQDKNLGATQAGVGCINYSNYCYANQEYYDNLEECLAYDGMLNCIGWEYFGDLFENQEDCEDRGTSLYESCISENGTGMLGYHYQWGNNHPFANPGVNGQDAITQSARTKKASWDNSYSNYGYNGSITNFMKGSADYWTTNSEHHDDLRGGASDSQSNNRGLDLNNPEDRQGPCSGGYHVPSIGERNKVLEYWAEENNIEENNIELEDNGEGYMPLDGMKFQEDFKLPFAGSRDNYDANVYSVGFRADLWSSSPNGGNEYARALRLYPDEADASNIIRRAHGRSVRCFKDAPLSFPTNESGDSGSGSASTHVTLTLTAGSNTCTLNDYNLGTHNASAEEQYIESSGQEILCEFLQNTGVRVLLSMGDLTDGSKLIGAENFTGVVTAIGNSLGSISNLTGGNYNLSGSQEIYRKAVNTLGKWTGDLQIIGTIPAGTPSGTYTGSLEIVIQEG